MNVAVLAFWCAVRDNGVMVNLRAVERDQLLLMPPSLSDWLPPDHLAWFIVDVVAELDLSEFNLSLRTDGQGGASYDPQVMLGILLYSYCVGERSSRRIEQRLCDDVAFRVIAVNQASDHAALARSRRRHQDAFAGVSSQVVGLCVSEGLVQSGVVAIDGTKIQADVSAASSVTRRNTSPGDHPCDSPHRRDTSCLDERGLGAYQSGDAGCDDQYRCVKWWSVAEMGSVPLSGFTGHIRMNDDSLEADVNETIVFPSVDPYSIQAALSARAILDGAPQPAQPSDAIASMRVNDGILATSPML